jgi:hypothetical protein
MTPGHMFDASMISEINGLIGKSLFQQAHISEVPEGICIYSSRFVHEIKGKNTIPYKPYEKSWLVVQAHNDDGKKGVLTQSPTIQQISQRLILCIAACLVLDHTGEESYKLAIWDISQAYVQSTTPLARNFYV